VGLHKVHGVTVKIEIDFPEIKIEDQWVEKLGLPKVIGQELQTSRTRIEDNLNDGKDANGVALRPYSPAYAYAKARGIEVRGQKKRKKSRPEKTYGPAYGGSTVNLLVTGELHRSMNVNVPKSVDEEGTITFQGTREGGLSNAGLAASLYARGFVGWFQLGKADLKRLQESIMKAIDKNIKAIVDIK